MSTPDRQELIRNAVAFLADPKSQTSPVSQRIQFLEAKGLTPAEIDLALKQATFASANQSVQAPYTASYAPNQYPVSHLPVNQRWDWRDYFITAVVSGAVTYGAVTLFKKYLLPHLQPPSSTAYEEDRDALSAQFDAAEALLKEIQAETASVRAAVEEQKERIDQTTEDVKAVVIELRDGESRTRDEMREIREEVTNIREMLPKMIEKNKESQNQSLAELQQELKSLKALLLSRGSTTSSTPASPLPILEDPSSPSANQSTPTAVQPVRSNVHYLTRSAHEPLILDMFSQFRNAVEQLAQPIRDASSLENHSEPPARSGSLDIQAGRSTSPLSSSELAESALSSLRKSLASQRSSSPLQSVKTPGSPSPPENTRPRKSNLEERLRRATFAIGDASGSPTPTQSSRVASPSPMSSDRKPMPPKNSPPISDSNSAHQEPSPINEKALAKEKMSTTDEESPSKLETAPVENAAVEESVNDEGHAQESVVCPPIVDNSAELESLQTRLKQVEQRFSDVSKSFKRLQAEKLAADAVLREATPLESIKDADGLRELFKNLKAKDDVFHDEINRLNQKLELQEDRIEELRDTHRLESHSRSDEVKKLKTQLDETEALFQAAQRATSHAEEVAEKHKEEIIQIKIELEKFKTTAKEEEEKRVKAISLLKTVRQKLVKAEKDKEDVMKEMAAVKERDTGDKEKEQAERQKFQREIENLAATHEQATSNMRVQFNKDYANIQERYKQEISALRGQFELDIASAKATHTKELSQKSSQIATLENSLNNVTRDKNAFFDQLQLRQAELESAQAHLESIQHQNTEFQFQLREANDRVALLKEECAELLREQESRSRDPVTSADDVARMVSATETKYEAKLSEMKRNLAILEKERHESEADWSRKLKEKVKELDDLKRVLGSAAKTREADENIVANLKSELVQAQKTANTLERQISELPLLREQLNELDKTLKEQEKESSMKILVLEKQIEETKAREAQVKQSNKTLREELRKVQSSAALLERQRNPGVGYWTTRVSESNGSAAEPRTPHPETPTRVSSPTPSTATSNKNEEEVNLEYLRNVILQFLEHKEMRPNLVKVLSIILHFTPQETRRLIAKV
ncbi:peroxisomal membrane anchor protein conserved region-domain-containing protein [Pholiota molesta]|nr:peroxisomal membrane anchor protein conserved region-domain-containing protein [Pholiota molesta]